MIPHEKWASESMIRYGLGLDLGSGSVGWAVVRLDGKKLRPAGVERLGVRRFDAGVSGDISGGRDESNAVERRLKRGPRRQHWRRQWRMRKVFSLLGELELLPKTVSSDADTRHKTLLQIDERLRKQFPVADPRSAHLLPYRLRALALDEPLSPEAFGRALYSLAQRRGFLSNRKAASEDDEDDGVVKRGIAQLDTEMQEHGCRTLGEYFANIDPESVNVRRRWTARRMFVAEFESIWAAQAAHHQLTEKDRKRLEKAIFYQRPLKSQRNLVGRCELERYPVTDEEGKRNYVGRRCAFIACLPFQEFRLLQKVNDLRYTEPDGRVVSMTDPECDDMREKLLHELSEQGEITFGAIRKLFGMKRSKDYGRNYVFNFEEGGESKLNGNRTAAKLGKMLGPSWHAMSESDQNRLVDEMLQFESADLLRKRLETAFQFDEETASKLSKVVLEQGFGSLSRRAMRKLLPLMREGKNYHDAKETCYPNRNELGEIHDLLPPVFKALPDGRSPSVVRVLTEMRKVVNGIIREMGGKPEWIRIELARDLKHSRDNRQRMQKRNRDNEKSREAASKKILKAMGGDERYATRDNILKIRLAEECGFVCPYSGDTIGMADLVGDEPKFEIEHTIPFSRSLDNSFVNKLLCRTDFNRDKGQNTPWEAFGDTPQYEQMVARVRMLRGDARDIKLEKFQMQKIDEGDDFVNRQLNETRYASRLAATYLGMLFGGIDLPGQPRRIFPTSGRVTAYLRQRWQLNQIIGHPDKKNRADHRHHAIDALVTALSDSSAVMKLSKAAERAEHTGDRLFAEIDPPFEQLIEQTRSAVDAIHVSSRVKRKVNGALHEETILSKPKVVRTSEGGLSEPQHHVRKRLNSLSMGEVEKIVDPRIKEIVERAVAAIGKPPQEAFKDPANLPAIHGRGGRTTIIRTVSIRKPGSPMAIGSESQRRYVNPGANHHMAVVAKIDNDGSEKKWEARLVTRFEALTRVRLKQPVVDRSVEDGYRFKFSLMGGDYVLLNRDGENDELCRVVVISGNQLEFILHSNANPATVRKKSPGERIRCSVTKLLEYQARKVDVDPVGRVFGVCEEMK